MYFKTIVIEIIMKKLNSDKHYEENIENNQIEEDSIMPSSSIEEEDACLKDKRGKVYKRSLKTRLKISIANKGRKPINGIKKGQVGKVHPSYKHGMGKNRDYEPEKRDAWIMGVKQKVRACALKRCKATLPNFRCFITGETRKDYLACHHLNAWNWCVEGRYDINNGICISKEIHQHFHQIFGYGEVKTVRALARA